jgi:uncharacterized protein YqhQ
MRRDYTLLFIGIWIIIVPFLGFPPSWKKIIFIVTGLIVISIGYAIWREYNKSKEKEMSQIVE